MKNLLNKKILFIICGGISAYKSLETIRLFKKNGAEIKTILTKSSKEFITPLSVASLSQGKVYEDLFSVENETEMDHIALSRWADVILISPITANTIAKLANGNADDLASTVVLASNKEIFITPAMNVRMWEHSSTKENFEKLENQTQLNRVKLSKDNEVMKKLTVFFMNTTITKALEKKFNTTLKFDSVDVWIDGKGYKLAPHTDNERIKLSLQIYLSDDNKGTSLYDGQGNIRYTFPFRFNSGYALYNNVHSHHGLEEIAKNGRISLYARYS